MIKHALKVVGVNTTGHGGRRLAITTFVNAPDVNPNESLGFARHASLAAQRPYVSRDGKSEMAKFTALGVVGQKKNGDDDANEDESDVDGGA